jgi:hypothetical protein
MNKKRLTVVIDIVVAIFIAGFHVMIYLNQQVPISHQFDAFGKQQTTKSVNGQYDVTSWNFTFFYRGEKTIQNVNFFLDSQDMPFKTVPEVTNGWVYSYIWTPEDLNATRTIVIAWQGGTESFRFQP